MATHYALALEAGGHTIVQVCSRDMGHARRLADRVGAQAVDSLSQVDRNTDVCIVAITDDALYDIGSSLSLGNVLMVHTSGTVPISVFRHVSPRHGVLWSPQSFVRDMAVEYAELPFCIEGSNEDAALAIESLARSVSPHIYRTSHTQRQYLHLASVFVNNFTNALYASAQQLCAEHGLPFEILYPIITTTTSRVRWGDVRCQLTGPAVRGDEKTINAHRRLLADNPQLLSLYDQLTALLQQIKP